MVPDSQPATSNRFLQRIVKPLRLYPALVVALAIAALALGVASLGVYAVLVIVEAPPAIFQIFPLLWALLALMLYVAALPLLLLKEAVIAAFPFVKRIWKSVVRVLTIGPFYLLAIALVICCMPVHQNPSAFAIIVLAVIAIGLGVVAGTIKVDFDPGRFLKGKLIGMIFTSLLFLNFPDGSRYVASWPRKVETWIVPEPVRLDFTAPTQIVFVTHLGDPTLFYSRDRDGTFYFYDAPGSCPITGYKLKVADSDAIRDQIRTWITARQAERLAAETRQLERDREAAELGRKSREEADRVAASNQLALKMEADAIASAKTKQAAAAAELERRNKEETERIAFAIQAKAAAAQERARREAYIARYVREGVLTNQSDDVDVAVFVVDGDNKPSKLALDLAALVSTNGVKASASLFTPAFFSDLRWKALFDGEPTELKSLDLSNRVDLLIAAKRTTTYSRNPDLLNFVSAKGVIEVRVIACGTGELLRAIQLSAVGAGFDDESASALLDSRLCHAIANDQLHISTYAKPK
jgi:hypothetical protein